MTDKWIGMVSVFVTLSLLGMNPFQLAVFVSFSLELEYFDLIMLRGGIRVLRRKLATVPLYSLVSIIIE